MVLDEIKKKERREGREEGLEEGIEIGREEGKEEGKSKERCDIVIQLLQKMRDANKVAELLDMSIKEVKEIAERSNAEI
ncbi:MAG: hypothetical protein Q4P22_06800 [Eubacteriales bacterium]|nr:hypothetical protein [Eubacteriales bacterium]